MTTADRSHELYEELAVGHALSALEPEDEQSFLAHLPSCAACEQALVEHTQTLGHLAYGVEQASPPESVLSGILAGVHASGRAGEFPAPAVAEPAVASLDQARERRRARTVRATTALLGAAASLVLVVALVFVNRGLQSENRTIQASDAALQTAVGSLVHTGSAAVDLSGDKGQKAVAVMDGARMSLVVDGLPVNDRENSTYVLWQRSRSGVVLAVGTFDVTGDGVSVVKGLQLNGEPSEVTRLIVTREAGRVAPQAAAGASVVSGDV